MLIFEPTLDRLIGDLKGSNRLFISAPWISQSRAYGLTKILDKACKLEIWVRMTPGEIAKEELLNVLETLAYFTDITVCRNQNLHWKAYISSSLGYIGSANFTERGLPDNVDANSSIEALILLTKEQLKESWKFKDNLTPKMQRFRDIEDAKTWWLKQRHKKIVTRYPDEVSKDTEDDDFPAKPKDYGIR